MGYETKVIRADEIIEGMIVTLQSLQLLVLEIKPLWYDKNKNYLVITGSDYEDKIRNIRVMVNEEVEIEEYRRVF